MRPFIAGLTIAALSLCAAASFAQEQAQIALFHLARRFAESQGQAIGFGAQREQAIVENQLDRNQFQGFAF